VGLLVALISDPAGATLLLSTSTAATLGGLSFQPGDLVEYDPGTDTATLFFDESLFSLTENIDAVSVRPSGSIILSTQGGATLGGLTFTNGDLAEYDPITDTATLFFDESLFVGNENVNATSVLSNGNILFTTTTAATLGGLAFSQGDLIEFNPNTDTSTLFFDGSLFSLTEDVDAVTVLPNGNLVLSTNNNATLGGLTFNEADLVEYNVGTDTATLFFDSNLFTTSSENIDAVAVIPEPSTALFLGLGLALLRFTRRRA